MNLPTLDWLQTALTKNITILSISPAIAVESCNPAGAGLRTTDPAEQMIVAAAMVHRLTLVTRDKEIIRWRGVPVVIY